MTPVPEAGTSTDSAGAVPSRQETFIARYPRKLKLAVAVALVAVLVVPWFFGGGPSMKKVKHEAAVQSADKITASRKTKPSEKADVGGPPVINDQDDRTVKLTAAPDPALSEDTPQGTLPRISEDGRLPWQAYARPFNTADKRPRIAIVISDLGLSRVISDAAITRLPANVTLAFDAQSPTVGAWIARARQDGHETLLAIPMEPFDFPHSDPGVNALLTTLPNTDNIERFMADLREGTGYVGITTFNGSRFTADPDKMRPVLETLKQRGLMIFDPRVAPHSVVVDMAHDMHLPAAEADTVWSDQNLTADSIDRVLDQLEKNARVTGHVIGIAPALPLVIDRMQIWAKGLPERGIALAPVSAMVQ